MPLRTISRGSVSLFLLISPFLFFPLSFSTDLSSFLSGSRNAFPPFRVFTVYSRERGDVLPTIRTGFSFLGISSPLLSCIPVIVGFVSRSPPPRHCLTLPFLSRLGCPGGPYESFNSIFLPGSVLRTSHDAVRRPSRSIYSFPRPALDPIPFPPRYKIIPNTYNLDGGALAYLLSAIYLGKTGY